MILTTMLPFNIGDKAEIAEIYFQIPFPSLSDVKEAKSFREAQIIKVKIDIKSNILVLVEFSDLSRKWIPIWVIRSWGGGNYMIKFKYEKATDTLPINGVLACAINGLLEKDLFKKLIEKSSLEYTEQEVDKSYIYRISVTTSKDLEKTYSLVHSFGFYLGEFNTLRM